MNRSYFNINLVVLKLNLMKVLVKEQKKKEQEEDIYRNQYVFTAGIPYLIAINVNVDYEMIMISVKLFKLLKGYVGIGA